MTDESPRSRVLGAGYTPAWWTLPAERFLAPGGAPRTVSLEEAIAEIDRGPKDDE
jgi:hypothetical protein